MAPARPHGRETAGQPGPSAVAGSGRRLPATSAGSQFDRARLDLLLVVAGQKPVSAPAHPDTACAYIAALFSAVPVFQPVAAGELCDRAAVDVARALIRSRPSSPVIGALVASTVEQAEGYPLPKLGEYLLRVVAGPEGADLLDVLKPFDHVWVKFVHTTPALARAAMRTAVGGSTPEVVARCWAAVMIAVRAQPAILPVLQPRPYSISDLKLLQTWPPLARPDALATVVWRAHDILARNQGPYDASVWSQKIETEIVYRCALGKPAADAMPELAARADRRRTAAHPVRDRQAGGEDRHRALLAAERGEGPAHRAQATPPGPAAAPGRTGPGHDEQKALVESSVAHDRAIANVTLVKAALVGLAILLVIGLGTGSAHWGNSPETQCAPPATAAVAGPDTDRVLGELGESNMPISYVLVIDVSAPMSDDDRYAEMQAMGRLIGSLTPQDDLAIVMFADTATTVRALSPRGSGAPQIPALPQHPAGSLTNIGLGIEKGIAALQDAPPGQPAALVLLTDSEQEASYGTRLADTYSADWTALHDQAELTRKDRPVDAYAVPLGTKTDVDLLCTVYEGVTLMPASTSANLLASYLGRVEANARLKAAAALVQRNNGQGVRASWELPHDLNINTGATTATLLLTNGARNLPVVIDGAQVKADGELPAVTSDLPRPTEARAWETKRILVHLSGSGPGAFSIFCSGRSEYTTTLSIAGAVSSPLARAGRAAHRRPTPRAGPGRQRDRPARRHWSGEIRPGITHRGSCPRAARAARARTGIPSAVRDHSAVPQEGGQGG